MSNLPLNFAYLTTKLGILKILSVVTGLLALALTAAAYDTAVYYKYKCTAPYRRGQGPRPGMIQHQIGTPLQDASSCEQVKDGTFQNCEFYVDKLKVFKGYRNTAREYLKKSRDNRANNFRLFGVRYRDLELVDDIPESCPYPWLVVLPVYLIGFIWATSFVMLIIQLVVDLNENSRGFLRIDFILQCIYAGLMLIATLFLTSFLIWVLTENYPCTQRLYEKHEKVGPVFSYLYEVGKNPTGSVGGYPGAPTGQSKPNKNPKTVSEEFLYANCLEETNGAYKLWLLISGLSFAVVTLALYGIAIRILNRRKRSAQEETTTDKEPLIPEDQEDLQDASQVPSSLPASAIQSVS